MEINLETDEELKLTIDGTCYFTVNGYRNNEGTMCIKVRHDYDRFEEKKTNPCKYCGKPTNSFFRDSHVCDKCKSEIARESNKKRKSAEKHNKKSVEGKDGNV